MVKLIVIARVIPEDVYLRSVEQDIPISSVLEKKFRVPVRNPESWYVGRLANEIKNSYERLYRRPLGEIKYLKDDEDDCDLDPNLSVSDLLVDEGKAAKDGSDQRVTVKIIQEQGRAIRAGSVIPDLSRVEYQPPTRPPVPIFSENKRSREEQYAEPDQAKRRRLRDIEEEESEHLVRSIEQDGERAPSHFELVDARFLSDLNSGAYAQKRPKVEPDDRLPWQVPQPATRDELELLPEAPKDVNFRVPRTGLPVPGLRQSRELEIVESSEANFDLERHNIVQDRGPNQPHTDHIQRRQPHPNAPFTPPTTGSTRQTSTGQAVLRLNGMKSASPADRHPRSHSAKKFRKPGSNGPGIYDQPESDIDDSQMSPGSRSSRRNIPPKSVTPILVATSQRRPTPYTDMNRLDRASTANTSEYTANARRNSELEHPRLSYVTSGSTSRKSATTDHAESAVENGRSTTSELQEEFRQHKQPSNHKSRDAAQGRPPSRPSSKRAAEDSLRVADERDSQLSDIDKLLVADVDGPRKKAKKQHESNIEEQAVRKSKSRSVSVTSSKGSSQSSRRKSRTTETADGEDTVAEISNQDDTAEELDGPGEQLLQSLNRSSPERNAYPPVVMNIPPRKTNTQSKSKTKPNASFKEVERDEVERLPESDFEEEENGEEDDDDEDEEEDKTQPQKKKKTKTPQNLFTGKLNEELRCLTCWRKKSKCDNAQPKCASCEKNKKNCQMFNMTREAADDEFRDRKSKAKPKASGKSANTKKNKTSPRQDEASSPKLTVPLTEKTKVTQVRNSQSDIENSGLALEGRPTSQAAKTKSGASTTSHDNNVQNGQGLTTTNKAKHNAKVPPQADGIDESAELPRPRSGSSDKAEGTKSVSRTKQQVPGLSQLRQQKSTESHASSSTHVLPPGMTEEEYLTLMSRRSKLTDEERRAENLRFRKSESRKESTPATGPRSVTSDTQTKAMKAAVGPHETKKQAPRSSSSQVASETSNEEVTTTRPGKRGSSSIQSSKKSQARKSLPATQPVNISASTNTPEPTKSVRQPATEPPKSKVAGQKRPTPVPISAAEKAAVVKNNPPFRPHKALTNSSFTTVNQATPVAHRAPPASQPSLGQAKSMSGLRNILLDKKKSASSTPQPVSAIDRLVAETKKASDRLNGFSFGGGDEDEEEETETESDDANEMKERGKQNISSQNMITIRKDPSEELETGSDLSDDDDL